MKKEKSSPISSPTPKKKKVNNVGVYYLKNIASGDSIWSSKLCHIKAN